MPDTVIIIPCYNEFDRLPVSEFKEYARHSKRVRFVFVDDGSTDRTGELLESLSSLDGTAFQIVSLSRNRGKGEAVREGFHAALGHSPKYVGYWDADLATPLDEIARFCRVLDESPNTEIVMGARVILMGHRIERRLVRHYLGRLSASLASFALGIRIYDAMCGAKLIRVTPRTLGLFTSPFSSRWVFDVEMAARFVHDTPPSLNRSGESAICELALQQWREIRGSKLRWPDFVRATVDLAKIFWRYRCQTPSAHRRGATVAGQLESVHQPDISSPPSLAISGRGSSTTGIATDCVPGRSDWIGNLVESDANAAPAQAR